MPQHSEHKLPRHICKMNKIRLYDKFILCHTANMSVSRRRTSRVFTISFPEDLAKQVVAVADEESRNISELFREAFRAYRIDKIHQRLAEIRTAAAKRTKTRYTEADVESLVDEIRDRNFRKRKKTA